MLGPLRTLISVAFLAVFLWAAFTVKLGRLTFADHVDRIGQTEEAKEFLDGARSRVRPALDEVKQRVLGEYVEAPTHLAAQAPLTPVDAPPRAARAPAAATSRAELEAPAAVKTAGRAASGASTADTVKLPGRRKRP